MTAPFDVQELWTVAERQRLMGYIAVLPCPRRVAESLPECALMALIHAERGNHGQYRLRYGVRDMDAGQILFSAGLVEARGPYLGNFGMEVRRHAIIMRAEGEFG
jgi:hypothetical protein